MSQTTVTVAKVQAGANVSGTSVSVTLGSSVAAGNMLVAAGFQFKNSYTAPGDVTDSRGNFWQMVQSAYVTASGPNFGGRGVWICKNAKPGTTTVTFNSSAGASETCLLVYELSGADQNGDPEVSVGAGASTNPPSTSVVAGSFTTVYPGDFLLAFIGQGSTTTTNSPGSGWTIDVNQDGSGGYGYASEYITNAAAGTTISGDTFTTAAAAAWVAFGMAIRVRALPNVSTGARDPRPTDTAAVGVGDFWLNTAAGRAFQCRDSTVNAARWMLLNRMVSVKDFGARGDAVGLNNVTLTSGSAVVTISSPNFSPFDVGKSVVALVLFQTTTTYLRTTIASVQSPTQVTLAASWPFGTFSTNTVFIYGTDDSAAIRAAITYALLQGIPGVYFPEANYLVTQARTLDPYVMGAPTVTNAGMTGSTSYSYQIIAHTASGFTSGAYPGGPPGVAVGTTTTGNLNLTNTNYNTVSWTAIPGAVSYDVLRWTGTAWQLCTGGSGVTATTFLDQSNTTTAYTFSVNNTVTGYTLVGDGPFLTTITYARPNGGTPAGDEYLFYNYNAARHVNISGIYFAATGFEQYMYNSATGGAAPVESIRHWNCYWFAFWKAFLNDGTSNTSEMLHVGCKCLGIGTLSTGLDNTGWFYKIQGNKFSVDHYFAGCDFGTDAGTIFLINAGGNLHVEQFSSVIHNNATFLTVAGPGSLIAQNNGNYNFRNGRIETHESTLLANISAYGRVHFEDVWGLSDGTPPTMTGITPSSYGSSSGAGRIQIATIGEVDFTNCYVPAGWSAVLAGSSNADYTSATRPTVRYEKCDMEYQLYDGVTLAFFTGSGTNNIGALGHAISKNCRNAVGLSVPTIPNYGPVDVHLGRMLAYHALADASYSYFWTYSPDQSSGLPMGGAQITTLSAAASQGASSFTVASGASMPTSGFVTIASDGTNAKENVAISSVVGNTVNILGTLAHAHSANSSVAGFTGTGSAYIPAGAFVKRVGIYWPGTAPSTNLQVQVLDSASNVLCDTGSRAGTNAGTVWADCGVNVSNNTKKQFNIVGIATGGQWIPTTLSGAATAGATSFTVANAVGLGAGMVLAIYGDGTNPGENITVGSVSGNTVTLAGGATLQSAHSSGASVAATAIPGGVFLEYY